jgi:hypothetical protein
MVGGFFFFHFTSMTKVDQYECILGKRQVVGSMMEEGVGYRLGDKGLRVGGGGGEAGC